MRQIWVDVVSFARLTWYLLQFVNYAKHRHFLGIAGDIDKPTRLDEWACLNDKYEALMPPSGPKSVSLRFRPAAWKIDDEGCELPKEQWIREGASTHLRASFVPKDACFQAYAVNGCVPWHVLSPIFCLPEQWTEIHSFLPSWDACVLLAIRVTCFLVVYSSVQYFPPVILNISVRRNEYYK